ncbi:hypothetical protein P171DRAFT_449457 [Karstenula rhodostoma CBS 690.94]|uniref:Uncharacterized protein n=1 Tax=Karstenula rhodostoma CBS 690.94 TaxID=1392251 RepID=A0A9P4U6Q6_9PLEO|nr:hypothetical protein P171DRAFT_449457 [Karstenula rhodostoma CBS 690.94]
MHKFLTLSWLVTRVFFTIVPPAVKQSRFNIMLLIYEKLGETPKSVGEFFRGLINNRGGPLRLRSLNPQQFTPQALQWQRITLAALCSWLTQKSDETELHISTIQEQKQPITSSYFKDEATKQFARQFIQITTFPGHYWIALRARLAPGQSLEPRDFFPPTLVVGSHTLEVKQTSKSQEFQLYKEALNIWAKDFN